MSSLRRSSSLPRRAFVHGLVLPLRLGSHHSRKLLSLPHALVAVVPLARLQGCGQKTELTSALRSVVRHIRAPRKNSFIAGASSPPAKVCFSAVQMATASSSRLNLKYEYEVQFSSCPGMQASRSQRSAESSFIPSGRVPNRPPNPPIERTCLRHAAHAAR